MISPTRSSSVGVIPATWKILSLQVRVIFNNFKRANKKRKITIAIFLIVIIAGIVFIYSLSRAILGFMRSPILQQSVGDFSQIIEAIPGLLVSAAFLGVLITSFGVLLQALYLAGDMEFLLSSPIPIRSVFLAKLLQAILPNFAIILLFAVPVFYGLGTSNSYHLLYYPFVLIILIVMAMAGAGIAALLVMLLVRIIPARRVAEVLGFLGAILAMVFSQIGNIINFGEISPGDARIQQTITTMERLNNPWIPLTWGGRGLIALGEGDWLQAVIQLTLTIGIGFGIFWLTLITAERLFYSGWAGMQIVSTRKKTSSRRRATGSGLNILFTWISPSIRAIIRKDFVVLRRDLRNLSQFVTPLIFGVIYSFLLLRNRGEVPTGQSELPSFISQGFRTALDYSSVGIAILVGWMLLIRLATMSFSHEHHSYWILKSAPVSTRQLVTAKFLVSFLPSLTLGLIFIIVINSMKSVSIDIWIYSFLVVTFCNAGLTGINIAFGIAGANFNWKDPRRMSSSKTGCLSSLASMLYMVINLFFFFALPIFFAVAGWSDYYGQLLGGLLGGFMSTVSMIVPIWIVWKRIPLLGESAQQEGF